jgi:hypothetical protein
MGGLIPVRALDERSGFGELTARHLELSPTLPERWRGCYALVLRRIR